MNLKDQLELRLNKIQAKIDNTKQAFKYCTELVREGLREFAYVDPLRNIFAKNSFDLEEILVNINLLVSDLAIFYKHKGIILIKQERTEIALKLLDDFEDKVNSIFTSLQSMAIYLENLKKNI